MTLVPNTVYVVKHTSGRIRWKFKEKRVHGGYGANPRSITRYYGVNVATGRDIVLKSTAKIQGEYTGA